MRPRDADPGHDRGVTHQAATWNLHVGRNPSAVADDVEAFLDDEGLDLLAVQEAGQYVGALRKRLRDDYRVISGRGSRSRRDSAVIVRRGLPARRKRIHALGGLGWERGQGRPGLHPARHMTSVQIGRGRHRFALGSVHLPPTPHARTMPSRGRAHDAALRVLGRITRRWGREDRLTGWVLAGDWNIRPGDRTFPFGDVTGRGIDYVVSDGATITRYRRGDRRGSDHRPALFTITI